MTELRDGAKHALVYFAGSSWEGIVGTDRRMAEAISAHMSVLWVDPPVPMLKILRERIGDRIRSKVLGLDQVAPNICRLRALGTVGLTRPVLRSISGLMLRIRLHLTLRAIGVKVKATVLATPEGKFPRKDCGVKIYYVTDDWPSGADMMGISRRRIVRLGNRNVKDSDLVAGVTPFLVEKLKLSQPSGPTILLANGCTPAPDTHDSGSGNLSELPDQPFAILIGQINERIDIELLQALADRELNLVMVGPRTERDPVVAKALDELLAAPSVRWLGRKEVSELARYMEAASVGLTPYRMNEFNQSSFPLKTLEYIAHGLPVVSTDLPAARWLNTDLVRIAGTVSDFVSSVEQELSKVTVQADREERRKFAQKHSWEQRARELLARL